MQPLSTLDLHKAMLHVREPGFETRHCIGRGPRLLVTGPCFLQRVVQFFDHYTNKPSSIPDYAESIMARRVQALPPDVTA